MSPRVEPRFPVSVSAMVTRDQAGTIAELAEQEQVSLSDVLRDVIKVGLPVIAKEYKRRLLTRELEEIEVPA